MLPMKAVLASCSEIMCSHQRRVKGIVQMEVGRPASPDAPVYSAAIVLSVCEDCGQVELYAEYFPALCKWLSASPE